MSRQSLMVSEVSLHVRVSFILNCTFDALSMSIKPAEDTVTSCVLIPYS